MANMMGSVGDRFRRRLVAWAQAAMLSCGACLMMSCGAFNPAFVNLFDTSETGQFSTLDNAPGHIVAQFVNNAEVDERLVSYLETTGGVVLTVAEKRALRPRVRIRILITFSNGIQLPFEFVDGSTKLIDMRFDAQAFPDLTQNDLDNTVAICDVARVEIAPGSSIEVFIPVELRTYELVEISDGDNMVRTEFQLRDQIPPQFRVLQQDQLDEGGNVVLQGNIGVRDFPAPAIQPVCGSVIAIVMNGVLRVPFLAGVDDNPSFDRDAAAVVAGIGGRFEFTVSVK